MVCFCKISLEVPTNPEITTADANTATGFVPLLNDNAKIDAVNPPIAAMCVLIFHLNVISIKNINTTTEAIRNNLNAAKIRTDRNNINPI